MSTHLALTARAFGAEEMYYTGDHDSHVEQSVKNILEDWGGKLKIEYINKPINFIEKWKEKGIAVHLTMFGIDVDDKIEEIKNHKDRDLLVIVGGAKVPAEVYRVADYNIAIGNQPHSEVAALAVFLEKYTEGRARKKEFENARMKIIPSERGKQVVEIKKKE